MSQETRFPSIKRKTDPLENEDENSGGGNGSIEKKEPSYEEFGLFLRPIATQQSRWHPDLSQADLREADLSRAYLSQTNLSIAVLLRANLREANLTKADLSKADLKEALQLHF